MIWKQQEAANELRRVGELERRRRERRRAALEALGIVALWCAFAFAMSAVEWIR